MERYWVEETARGLGFDWHIEDNERPDFLVTSQQGRFALEVTQVHLDDTSQGRGSALRARERSNQKWADQVLREAVECAGVPLTLQFLGRPSVEAAHVIVDEVNAEAFANQPLLHRIVREGEWGKFWVRRTLRSLSIVVGDSVGLVSVDGAVVQRAIDLKAGKLLSYAAAVPDVRLLVVAARRKKSGMVSLAPEFQPQLRGFNWVYFISAPHDVRAFSDHQR